MIKYLLIIVALIFIFSVGFFSGMSFDTYKNGNNRENIEKQKKEVEAEKEALRATIREKQDKEVLMAVEIAQLNSLIEKSDKRLKNEKLKLEEALKIYEKEINTIDITTDSYTRCVRLCANRSELGYPCASDFCDKFK